jgi:hypothetical protein
VQCDIKIKPSIHHHIDCCCLQELEDMLLRYERQLKQSEGARMAAEQAARSATAAADEARQLLASSGRQAKQRSAHLAVEAEAVQQVRYNKGHVVADVQGVATTMLFLLVVAVGDFCAVCTMRVVSCICDWLVKQLELGWGAACSATQLLVS